MTTNLKIGIIIIFIIGAMSVGYMYINHLLGDEKISNAKLEIEYFRRAINAYVEDSIEKGLGGDYPDTLEVLVSENYLTPGELSSAKRNYSIRYHNPQQLDSSSEILLEGVINDRLIICPVVGELQIRRSQY